MEQGGGEEGGEEEEEWKREEGWKREEVSGHDLCTTNIIILLALLMERMEGKGKGEIERVKDVRGKKERKRGQDIVGGEKV